MPDFGFVGASYVAPSIYQDDQECINLYPEVDPTKKEGERGQIALYPTPGLDVLAVFGAGNIEIRGMWVVPGNTRMFLVAGNTLWDVTSITAGVPVATLLTSSGQVVIVDNGTSIYLADGVARYAYNYSTGVFTTCNDGAFIGADRVDYVDNYNNYNNPGTNEWGCTDLGGTTSSGLNFARKDSSSDNIVTLMASKGEIFLLGERTGEVWVDAGLFPFPFQRLGGTSIQHGCAAKHSISRLGESVAWLSADSRGRGVVIMLVGYTPQRISTHALESAMARYSTISDAIAYTYQKGGHEFYVLTFPTADVTWVFDLATGLWHKRAWRDGSNVLHRHRGNCSAIYNGLILVGDWQNGLLYAFDETTYTDAGAPIPCIRRCPHLTSDLKRQFFHELQIQFQPGVGLQTGQGSDPQAMLRYSDDGGSTWSQEKWVSIGKVGQYRNRARWTQLGEARDRIFEVTVTDPVYRTIISANLEASLGGS